MKMGRCMKKTIVTVLIAAMLLQSQTVGAMAESIETDVAATDTASAETDVEAMDTASAETDVEAVEVPSTENSEDVSVSANESQQTDTEDAQPEPEQTDEMEALMMTAEEAALIPGATWENAIEIEAGKKYKLKLVRAVADEVTDPKTRFVLYVKFTPNKSGMYQVNLKGKEVSWHYENRYDLPREAFPVVAGESVWIRFERGGEGLYGKFDFEASVSYVEEWAEGKEIKIDQQMQTLSFEKNTVYPVTFTEAGTYQMPWDGLKIYRLVKGMISQQIKPDAKDKNLTFTVDQGETVYIQAGKKLDCSIFNKDKLRTLQLGRNEIDDRNAELMVFTPAETGTYLFINFYNKETEPIRGEYYDHKDYFAVELTKDTPFIVKTGYGNSGYILKPDEYSIAQCGTYYVKAEELVTLCYKNETADPVSYQMACNDDEWLYSHYAICDASKKWTVTEADFTRDGMVTLQPGDTLYLLYYGGDADWFSGGKVTVRKLVSSDRDKLTSKTKSFSQKNTNEITYLKVDTKLKKTKKGALCVSNAGKKTTCRKGNVNADGSIVWSDPINIKGKQLGLDCDYLAIYENKTDKNTKKYRFNFSKTRKLVLNQKIETNPGDEYIFELPKGQKSGYYEFAIKDKNGFIRDGMGEDDTFEDRGYWIITCNGEMVFQSCRRRDYVYLEKGKKYDFTWLTPQFSKYKADVSFATLRKLDQFGVKIKAESKSGYMINGMYFTAPEDAYVEVQTIANKNKKKLPRIKCYFYEKDDRAQDTPVKILEAGKTYFLRIDERDAGSFYIYNNKEELTKIRIFQELVAKIGSGDQITLASKSAIDSATAALADLDKSTRGYVIDEQLQLEQAKKKYKQLAAADPEGVKKAAEEAAKQENIGAEQELLGAVYVVGKGQTVTLKKLTTKNEKDFTIPESILVNGKAFKVTEIASGAFENHKKLKQVVIPRGVKKIGNSAFYNCKSLKTVTINTTGLKTVGKNAFKKIGKKASVQVPQKKLKAYQKLLKKKVNADAVIKKL